MTRHTPEHPPDREEENNREHMPPGLPANAALAYDDFVRYAYPRAIGFCIRSGNLSQAQAEDLVQIALMVAWIKWPDMSTWEPGRQRGYFGAS
ncbi:sigma-70 family RNA polymerase sigma factor [Streptomyces sp. ISL-10]|uniref:hypothetical protein n=1 Tax=Streptomyces sp. ISL-10 TaxID=2819172 RepID=UPI001BE675C1|nr:hypothetical protein [Streptomyces sp. ISL-10]MBT2369342.1 sigma-70 family RNA polymerase sigma factor [Streptomyces sp. ISL-10]